MRSALPLSLPLEPTAVKFILILEYYVGWFSSFPSSLQNKHTVKEHAGSLR